MATPPAVTTGEQPTDNSGFFVKLTRKLHWYKPLGFTNGFAFALFLILGGPMLTFVLKSLAILADIHLDAYCKDASNPVAVAECFHFLLHPLYRWGFLLHLAGILLAMLLAFVQFIPLVRREAMYLHRFIGYVVSLLSVAGTVGAFVIMPVTFGGAFDAASALVMEGVAFLVSLAMALVNIKRLRIDRHRIWMLRAWVNVGSILTARFVMVSAALVISSTGSYYYSLPCEQLDWLLGGMISTLSQYQGCEEFYADPAQKNLHVSVLDNIKNAASIPEGAASLYSTFGGSLWMCLFLHVVGTEIYIQLTPAEDQRLREISNKLQEAQTGR